MLDMGFAEDLDAILEARRPSGRPRSSRRRCRPASWRLQNGICGIRRASRSPARSRSPASCRESVRSPTSTARAHKPAALERVLETENPDSAPVFCRTRHEVDTLVELLNARGHRAEALHGGMEQRQRDRVMGRFREGTVDLLIATDVAARGLDIERLSHVINYDVPASADVYVHRIGRTGRTGLAAPPSRSPSHGNTVCSARWNRPRNRRSKCPIPTVADLRARRLEITRASLRERLLAGNLDHTRVVVESLANEFDIVDTRPPRYTWRSAAGGEGDDREIPTASPRPEKSGRRGR